MLGAIIGDTAGSVYEFNNIKTTDFPFFSNQSIYTDNSVMSFAVADWLLHDNGHTQPALEETMVLIAQDFRRLLVPQSGFSPIRRFNSAFSTSNRTILSSSTPRFTECLNLSIARFSSKEVSLL